MNDITPKWRPRQSIRAVAIGLPFRDGKLLTTAITEDNGSIVGWRPLGGGIEFGERAESALVRELHEELQARVKIVSQIGVFEEIFSHHGSTGHEIIFAFEVILIEPGQASNESFILEDDDYRSATRWIPIADFANKVETLLPEGLLEHIEGLAPTDASP